MRTLPTEESLGLSPTDEELATSTGAADDLAPEHDEPEAPPPAAAKQADPAAPALPDKPEDAAKTVDLRALQEARAEAREAKQRAALLEQRWNDYLAGQSKPAPAEKPADPVPTFDADPLAAAKWTQEQLVAMREAESQRAEQTAAQQRQETEFQQVFERVNQDFVAAERADPAVRDAYNKLLESQGNELLAMGYTIPQAKAELAKIERGHIQFVASRGMNIGEYVKALASTRGWQPPGAAPAQAQVAPAAAQPARTDLAALASAQQRHQSLSDAPGGEGVPPLDAKALARMSDKDFKAWMSKKGNEQKFDEIMGR